MNGKLLRLFSVFTFLVLILVSFQEPTSKEPFAIDNFEKAKKALRRIYRAEPIEFYCGCQIVSSEEKNQYEIDPTACGLNSRKNEKRSTRLEWEHIMPASEFGRTMACWQGEGCESQLRGRKCCRKIDAMFQMMEGDMHNLVPSAGELNADRGNFEYGEIPGEERKYGACDFEVDFKEKIVEIRPEIRGIAARAYLYMAEKYGLRLEDSKKQMFSNWNKLYPPTEWEKKKASIVERLQGNKNPYVEGEGSL